MSRYCVCRFHKQYSDPALLSSGVGASGAPDEFQRCGCGDNPGPDASQLFRDQRNSHQRCGRCGRPRGFRAGRLEFAFQSGPVGCDRRDYESGHGSFPEQWPGSVQFAHGRIHCPAEFSAQHPKSAIRAACGGEFFQPLLLRRKSLQRPAHELFDHRVRRRRDEWRTDYRAGVGSPLRLGRLTGRRAALPERETRWRRGRRRDWPAAHSGAVRHSDRRDATGRPGRRGRFGRANRLRTGEHDSRHGRFH